MDVVLIITILGCAFPILGEISTTADPVKCPTNIPNGTMAAGCSRTVSSYCTYWCDYSWCSKRFTELFCNQYGSWSAGETACLCEGETTTTEIPALCPKYIPNGTLSLYCSRRPFTICRVYCARGCISTTANVLTCDSSGRWFDEDTACSCTQSGQTTTTESLVVCPKYIPNGMIDMFCSRRRLQTCRTFCYTGCISTTADTLTCDSSGRWIGGDTACNCTQSGETTTTEEPVLCPVGIPNGRLLYHCSREPSTICTGQCNEGCHPAWLTGLICDRSGRWIYGDTACNCTGTSNVRCPAFIPNGSIDRICRSSTDYACEYTCNLRCTRVFPYLQCASNGTWLSGDTACNCKAQVRCPKEINNGQVDGYCSRKNGSVCNRYDCADNCDKDPNVTNLACRNGTWYSLPLTHHGIWTTEHSCKCDPPESLTTSAIIGLILGIPAFLSILGITICVRVMRRKRKRMASSGSATVRESTQQSTVSTRTTAAAPQTADRTAATQSVGAQNGASSPIYMLSNTVTYQSVQYTESQNSCYLVPEAASSNVSLYPDAPPSYSSIAAAKPEEFPPPPSYEEAVSHLTSQAT